MLRSLMSSVLISCAVLSSSLADEPLQKTQSIDEQIKALDDASPIAAEVRKVNKQIEEARAAAGKAAESATEELQKHRNRLIGLAASAGTRDPSP